MNLKPVITGIGLLTPLGASAQKTWDALIDGKAISTHCKVPGFADPERSFEMAATVAHEAIEQAGWGRSIEEHSTAIVVGTSKGPVEQWLTGACLPPPSGEGRGEGELRAMHLVNRPHPNPLPEGEGTGNGQIKRTFGLALIADYLANRFHGVGARLTLSAACASGLHALIRACMMIESGEVRRVLVVGVEASVHPLFLSSFSRLKVLAPEGFGCRPFDINRQGFLMSEAAAAICLEHPDEAKKPIARVNTYALGGDATHLTGGDPTGATLKYLLRRAISDNLIDLVHAHGTGTLMNDRVELHALESVMASRKIPVPLYSHKGALGHSLGASGLISVVLNCLSHQSGIVLGNVQTKTPMTAERLSITSRITERRIEKSIVIATGFGGPTAVVGIETP